MIHHAFIRLSLAALICASGGLAASAHPAAAPLDNGLVGAGSPSPDPGPTARGLDTGSAASGEPPQLHWARRLVAEVSPKHNRYNWSPTYVVWTEDGKGIAKNRSVCSSFVSHDLERAYGFGTDELLKRFGLKNPQAKDYYDTISAGRGFQVIPDLADVMPGDIIAVKYPAGSHPTGHVMMIDGLPKLQRSTSPKIPGTKQYDVAVIDSSHSYHGFDDTRYVEGGKKGQGVGRGNLRVYVDASGAVTGYTWSTRTISKYFPQSEHQMVFGRFEPTYAGAAAPVVSSGTSDESEDSST